MMKTLFVVVAVAVAFATAAAYEKEDGVAVLTTANFDAVVGKEEFIVVEFYAPWCGHCKSLAPEYAKAAAELEADGIILAKVDATVESDLGSRFDVRGYPTLKVFRNGEASEYKGGRTADTIVSYVRKQMLPACTTLASAADAAAFRAKGTAVIGFFPAASGEAYAGFQAVVSQLRDDFLFGEVVDAAVAAELGVAAGALPAARIYPAGAADADAVTYTGDITDRDALIAFIRVESLPLIDEVSRDNYKLYMDAGLPLAWVFIDVDDAAVKGAIEPHLLVAAKTFRGKINFVYCNGIMYKQQATSLGLSGETLPGLALLNPATNDHYAFDEATKLETPGAVAAWLQSFVDGTLAPTIKSEAVPASQDGPVYVLVGSTFEEIAYDKSKDVLVEFYAPWCGHCKNLAPIWDELGTTFKDVDSVVIAKMDATTNDATGVAIQGFPTIKFFPAGATKPVDYSGGRELDNFVEYIKNNARIPFSLDGVAAGGASAAHDEL